MSRYRLLAASWHRYLTLLKATSLYIIALCGFWQTYYLLVILLPQAG